MVFAAEQRSSLYMWQPEMVLSPVRLFVSTALKHRPPRSFSTDRFHYSAETHPLCMAPGVLIRWSAPDRFADMPLPLPILVLWPGGARCLYHRIQYILRGGISTVFKTLCSQHPVIASKKKVWPACSWFSLCRLYTGARGSQHHNDQFQVAPTLHDTAGG